MLWSWLLLSAFYICAEAVDHCELVWANAFDFTCDDELVHYHLVLSLWCLWYVTYGRENSITCDNGCEICNQISSIMTDSRSMITE